jgi:hypothetical protein
MHNRAISNLLERVEKCRRLAASSNDELTAKVLRRMADEGEEDIRRLLIEGRNSTFSGSPW